MTGRSEKARSGEEKDGGSSAPGAAGPAAAASSWREALLPGRECMAAVFLSAAVFVFAHWQGFVNPYAINDDVRQQVFWMQRYQDPALYPPDMVNQYAEAYVPLGVSLIYKVPVLAGEALEKAGIAIDHGHGFTNPVQFTKIVTGLLFLLQCWLFFRIGLLLGGRGFAWALAAMAWLMPFFLENISGGLARAFASPILAWFCLALIRGNPSSAPLWEQALLIPYIFLPTAPALFVAQAREAWRETGKRARGFARIVFVFAMGTVVAYANSMAPQKGGFGPLVSLAEATGRPEFGPVGRLDLVPLPNPFLDFVYYPFERIGLFKELGLVPGIVSLVLLAPLLWYGGRAVDWRGLGRSLKPLALTGLSFLAFYIAARILAFTLFVPDRYAQYPVNLLYALLLAACLAGAVKRLRPGRSACLALILLAAALGAVRLQNVALYDYRADAPLHAAVEAATPKQAMLAGHPELMDNVLTFARRNAYATFELAHPWSRGYWLRLAPRLEGFFKAYYAAEPAEVIRFAKQSGVDFLVVDMSHFTPGFLSGRPFFEPFGAAIKAMVAGRGTFAVLDERSFPRQELRPGAFLIDLRPLRAAASP